MWVSLSSEAIERVCVRYYHVSGTVQVWVVAWPYYFVLAAMETVGAHLCVWHNTVCLMWLSWGRHMAVFTLYCASHVAVSPHIAV